MSIAQRKKPKDIKRKTSSAAWQVGATGAGIGIALKYGAKPAGKLVRAAGLTLKPIIGVGAKTVGRAIGGFWEGVSQPFFKKADDVVKKTSTTTATSSSQNILALPEESESTVNKKKVEANRKKQENLHKQSRAQGKKDVIDAEVKRVQTSKTGGGVSGKGPSYKTVLVNKPGTVKHTDLKNPVNVKQVGDKTGKIRKDTMKKIRKVESFGGSKATIDKVITSGTQKAQTEVTKLHAKQALKGIWKKLPSGGMMKLYSTALPTIYTMGKLGTVAKVGSGPVGWGWAASDVLKGVTGVGVKDMAKVMATDPWTPAGAKARKDVATKAYHGTKQTITDTGNWMKKNIEASRERKKQSKFKYNNKTIYDHQSGMKAKRS